MATGIITIKNPNGKSGTFKVVTVGPDDECDTQVSCEGKELTWVDPQGTSIAQGANAIGKIVNAGNSGVLIVINIQPA